MVLLSILVVSKGDLIFLNALVLDKRLKEAKLLSMEQRRYHMIPEL